MTVQPDRPRPSQTNPWAKCSNPNCECRADEAITIQLTDRADVE
jgi:hypothetical protein